MGNNCVCFKAQDNTDHNDRSTGESKGSDRRQISNSTIKNGNKQGYMSAQQNGQPVKNVFKKKRGEGYIPPHIQAQQEENLPKQSLGTYCLLNQKPQQEEPINDAVVAGTFGGDKLPLDKSGLRGSLAGSNSGNSFHQQSTH